MFGQGKAPSGLILWTTLQRGEKTPPPMLHFSPRRQPMQLTIANVSTQVTHKEFRAAVAAIGKQVTLHFKPEWGVGATLKAIALPLGAKKAPIQRDADAIIYLGDSSSDPN